MDCVESSGAHPLRQLTLTVRCPFSVLSFDGTVVVLQHSVDFFFVPKMPRAHAGSENVHAHTQAPHPHSESRACARAPHRTQHNAQRHAKTRGETRGPDSHSPATPVHIGRTVVVAVVGFDVVLKSEMCWTQKQTTAMSLTASC